MSAPHGQILDAILDILSDGKAHSADELHKCCGPSRREVVQNHVSRLRKILNPLGQDILCVFRHKRRFYQHVRLLAKEE